MKSIFVVVSTNVNGKHRAVAETVKCGENLMNIVERYNYPPIMHLCESRTQAEQTAIAWNKAYQDNGTAAE